MSIIIHELPLEELNATINFTITDDDFNNPYLSATDIAKLSPDYPALTPKTIIQNWMRRADVIGFLTVWEEDHNPNFCGLPSSIISGDANASTNFKGIEFNAFKTVTDILNVFYGNIHHMSPKKWIEKTNAIGIVSSAGRYNGGTYMHDTIALKFAESLSYHLDVRIHEGYKKYCKLIDPDYTVKMDILRDQTKATCIKRNQEFARCNPGAGIKKFANEADMINYAVFGMSAKEWRELRPELVVTYPGNNMRNFANREQLIALKLAEQLSTTLTSTMPSRNDRYNYIVSELYRQLGYTARKPHVRFIKLLRGKKRDNDLRAFTEPAEAASGGIIIDIPHEIHDNIRKFVRDGESTPDIEPKKLMYKLI